MELNTGNFKKTMPFVINETVKDEETGINKYQEVAKIDLPIPLLADFGIEAEQSKDEAGKDEFDDDGIPVYSVDALDWLQSAILQQVKAQSRNKFVKGKLKDGQKLAETFAELVAVGERSGEALKARHAAKASFAAYLKSKNKKDVVVKLISDLFIDANSISVAKDDFVDALSAHITAWIPSLDESDKLRFERTIAKAVDAVNGRAALLDDIKASDTNEATA
jgi:hypothetical protein